MGEMKLWGFIALASACSFIAQASQKGDSPQVNALGTPGHGLSYEVGANARVPLKETPVELDSPNCPKGFRSIGDCDCIQNGVDRPKIVKQSELSQTCLETEAKRLGRRPIVRRANGVFELGPQDEESTKAREVAVKERERIKLEEKKREELSPQATTKSALQAATEAAQLADTVAIRGSLEKFDLKTQQALESNTSFAKENFLKPNRASKFRPKCDSLEPGNQNVERVWMPGNFVAKAIPKEQVVAGNVEPTGPAKDRVLEKMDETESTFPHWKTKVDGRGTYTAALAEELVLNYSPHQVELRESGDWSRTGFAWPDQRAEVDHIALLTVYSPSRAVCVTARHIGNFHSDITHDWAKDPQGERTTGLRLTGKGAGSRIGMHQLGLMSDTLLEGFALAEIKHLGGRGLVLSIVGRNGERTKVPKLTLIGDHELYLENVDLGELWVIDTWKGKLHLKNTNVKAYYGSSSFHSPLSMHEEGGKIFFSKPGASAAPQDQH